MKTLRLNNLRQLKRLQQKILSEIYYDVLTDNNKIQNLNKSITNMVNIIKLDTSEPPENDKSNLPLTIK